MRYTDLPTVEEAQRFLELVNVGRKAVGAEPLEKLNFDRAQPNIPTSCLSATNLFCIPEVQVEESDVYSLACVWSDETRTDPRIAEALHMDGGEEGYMIPDEIKAVTDPFDRRAPGLKARLVEAGVA
jgi:hypothetical protein